MSQITLKATLPGVPDFYQGTEFWDFSMVDPDNRRPVDYAVRASALERLENPDWPELVRQWPDGRLKLAWTRELLAKRQQYSDLFAGGDYLPLEVHRRDSDHVIAFARRHGRNAAVIAVARRLARFTDDGRSWPKAQAMEAEIDLGKVKQAFRRDRIPISEIFKELPVAVIIV
jgi:(1->4)-alpha-D-glucan 1-alpha-D-glucosylmutase